MPRSRISRVVRWTMLVLVPIDVTAAAWACMVRSLLVPRFQSTNGLGFAGVQSPTWGDYCQVWGPLVASGALTLAALGGATVIAKGWSPRTRRLPRVTMLQGMAAIGAIAVWLWLFRLNAGLTLAGSIVLSLLAHAAWRRGSLAKELKSAETTAPSLARAGFFGYSLAALLAIAWVFSIYLWDIFMQYNQQLYR